MVIRNNLREKALNRRAKQALKGPGCFCCTDELRYFSCQQMGYLLHSTKTMHVCHEVFVAQGRTSLETRCRGSPNISLPGKALPNTHFLGRRQKLQSWISSANRRGGSPLHHQKSTDSRMRYPPPKVPKVTFFAQIIPAEIEVATPHKLFTLLTQLARWHICLHIFLYG